MSRFADPTATKRMDLGSCECPGTPHTEGDWIEMRTSIGVADALRMTEGSIAVLGLLIVSWNLLDNDGEVAEVNEGNIGRLFGDVFSKLDTWIEENVTMASVPNGSGAPSRNGIRVSASQTRGNRKRPGSTTS